MLSIFTMRIYAKKARRDSLCLGASFLPLVRSPVSKISFPERPIGRNDGLPIVDHIADDATPGAETSAIICAPLFPAPTTATFFPLKSSADRY